MKYILIRDDDVNFFTKIDDINKVYSFIFEREIPINFAIIPNVDASAKTISNNYPKNSYEPFILKEYHGKERQRKKPNPKSQRSKKNR